MISRIRQSTSDRLSVVTYYDIVNEISADLYKLRIESACCRYSFNLDDNLTAASLCRTCNRTQLQV